MQLAVQNLCDQVRRCLENIVVSRVCLGWIGHDGFARYVGVTVIVHQTDALG